jgi:serralysin
MPVTGNGTAATGLGGPAGYGETELARGDDVTRRLDLGSLFPAGLNFLGRHYGADQLYVSSNGVLSFAGAFSGYPTAENAVPGRALIAPFWGDVDTRLDGEGAESGSVWIDIESGQGVLSITWDHVGVYRRNAEDTNRFQLQLFDRGNGDFDIAFRYEHVSWTIGTAPGDAGARIGLAGEGEADPLWMSGIDDLTMLPQIAGNTGAAGLWVLQIRDGALLDPPWISEPGGGGEIPPPEPPPPDPAPEPPTPVGRMLVGGSAADTLSGGDGSDTIEGRGGKDLLQGNDGNDTLIGGDTSDDLGDTLNGGEGDDSIDGGYGNDRVSGGNGNDTVEGGFGVDTIIGNAGDDVLTGSAYSDLIFGGDGFDFINGGFGSDRVNGGDGGDRFFHIGLAGHGSDWIQDYDAAEGDILRYGGASRDVADFQVNFANTAGAGSASVDEAFVIYRPTGQILWALIDGGAQTEINIQLGGDVYDLLA